MSTALNISYDLVNEDELDPPKKFIKPGTPALPLKHTAGGFVCLLLPIMT